MAQPYIEEGLSMQPILMEEWRDIAGYEGHYQVSAFGRVKSLAREEWFGNRWCSLRERILVSIPCGQYHHRIVNLAMNGKHAWYVHRLVLGAFVGPCPPGMESCHFPDRDPANNRLDNLRWGTHQDNMLDRDKHGSLNGKMARTWNPLWVRKGKNTCLSPT